MIPGLGGTIVFGIEIAFFIHDLSEGKIQNFACFSFQMGFHIPGYFLTEVDDGFSFWSGKDAGSGKMFLFMDFFTLLGNQGIGRTLERDGVMVKYGFIRGIIDFSVINFRKADPAFGAFPGLIRTDGFLGTVHILNCKLDKKPGWLFHQCFLVGGS